MSLANVRNELGTYRQRERTIAYHANNSGISTRNGQLLLIMNIILSKMLILTK